MRKSMSPYSKRERKWFWGVFIATVIAFGLYGVISDWPSYTEIAVDDIFWGIIFGLSFGSNVRNILHRRAQRKLSSSDKSTI